jgi:hypothetical protein
MVPRILWQGISYYHPEKMERLLLPAMVEQLLEFHAAVVY